MGENKIYRINEIFYSIQGEGSAVGQAAIFVRFSNCNLNCSFCDTEFKTINLRLTLEGVIEEIKKYIPIFENSIHSPIIVWTGGEPLLQLDGQLLKSIHKIGFQNHIESNGTIELESIGLKDSIYIDNLTISPKDKQYPKSLKQLSGHDLKIVYQGQTEEELNEYLELDFLNFYLQPCSQQNVDKIIEIIKKNPSWILSYQIQKIINIK